MYILGINGGVRPGYQDISAVLMQGGKVLAAIEEERLNRIKFSPGQLPEKAIEWVLQYAGITIKDVGLIASHGSTWGEEYASKLKGYFEFNFGYCPPIEFVHHHMAHAASTFYPSGFDKAMVITYDGSGDGVATQLAVGDGTSITVKERISRPHSLGIFYSMFTQYCGFKRDSDEYKLMGLAPYGNPLAFDFSGILNTDNGLYTMDDSLLKPIPAGQSQPTRQEMMFSNKLIALLGSHRVKGQTVNQHYMDVAASAQLTLENVIIKTVTSFHKQTGLRKLCIAGGVALNCLVNQKLMNLPFIDALYVCPASSDAGVSLGAAMYAAVQNGFRIEPYDNVFWGPGFNNDAVKETLDATGVRYTEVTPDVTAANLVAQDKVVAWFQGRMEFGPRALGARSILANPCNSAMKDLLNKKIKFRESFRPFCPSVTEKFSTRYFKGKNPVSPYMTITYDVLPEKASLIPAVTHVNNTARIQTVNENQNALYFSMLNHFATISGHPVVVNTSFNTNNEPIVCSPSDALASFYKSGIDALIIGNFLIHKPR